MRDVGRASDALFDAAIFDMDGLLLDSERPIRAAWLRAAAVRGIALSADDYQSVIGTSEAESRRRLGALLGGDHVYAMLRADAAHALRDATFPPKPGALRRLDVLRENGVATAVASSTVRREVERRLDVAGLGRYVESVTGGDEVAAGRGKPHPDLYWLAAERIRTRPSRCIVFEDSEPGALAALAAGMQVVVVPDLKAPPAAVCRAALHVLDSLESGLGHCATWFGCSGK
jgi:HAD superfamily hydrolase (TIGR01509 family)